MTTSPRRVIFGTGAIGPALLDALHRRGETARMVNRSGTAGVPDDVEVVAEDARDRTFTTAVARGACCCPRASIPAWSWGSWATHRCGRPRTPTAMSCRPSAAIPRTA